MPETLEGEIVPERGLTTITQGTAGLAALTDEQFEARLTAIKKGQERILAMQRSLLVVGVDYANIPDVDKPSLGKPGAEKLCLAYGLVVRVETNLVSGDGGLTPPITWDAIAHFYLGDFDGPEVGVGHGTANSFERKYRYRNADRVCPKCGKKVRHSKPPKTGWYCWLQTDGCGYNFDENDSAIKDQAVGQVDNPDPYDLSNTLMKMAEKRAVVDGTLRVTASSGIFTQDLEDNLGSDHTSAASGAPSGGDGRRAASGTPGQMGQASPSAAPSVNNAALDAFLNGDPGPVSDAEMVAMVDGEPEVPECPNGHGPMAPSNYGGPGSYWCRTCKAKIQV